ADLRTSADVTAISPDGEVTIHQSPRLRGRLVLSGVGPAVLAALIRAGGGNAAADTPAEGAQVKINMLLRRLPRLHDTTVRPEAAFGGTFHVNETLSQLDRAFDVAAGGGIPSPL